MIAFSLPRFLVRIAPAILLGLACRVDIADAQSALRVQPNRAEKAKLVEQIAADGLNCPVVGVVENAEEDKRGKMIRVHCTSLNGSASWDIRGIAAPNAPELRFEAW